MPFSFNRKEEKDHGEGGVTVGAELVGRVVIVDDVVTVDESGGLISPLITYDGGSGSDTLQVTGSTTVTDVVYDRRGFCGDAEDDHAEANSLLGEVLRRRRPSRLLRRDHRRIAPEPGR